MKNLVKSEIYHLGLFSLFAIVVLCYRLLMAENILFIFLAWNLFLAWIPYLITLRLEETNSRLFIFLKLILWILFLPNAPYLITDMLHLHPRNEVPYWLDTLILFIFAANGILLFYASSKVVWSYLGSLHQNLPIIFMPLAFGMCGYGIYLGRWLRFNSWDVLYHPFRLTNSLLSHTFNPVNLMLISQVTLIFGAMLFFVYRAIQNLR